MKLFRWKILKILSARLDDDKIAQDWKQFHFDENIFTVEIYIKICESL